MWVSVCSVLSLYVWPRRARFQIQAWATAFESAVAEQSLMISFVFPFSFLHYASFFWHTLCLCASKLAQVLSLCWLVDWKYEFSWKWFRILHTSHLKTSVKVLELTPGVTVHFLCFPHIVDKLPHQAFHQRSSIFFKTQTAEKDLPPPGLKAFIQIVPISNLLICFFWTFL